MKDEPWTVIDENGKEFPNRPLKDAGRLAFNRVIYSKAGLEMTFDPEKRTITLALPEGAKP